MKARRPVKTVIDYRPAATIERPNEADQHDREAARLPDQTLLAAAHDLVSRKCWDPRDAEHRWVLARRAALLREIRRRKLQP